MLEEFWKRDIEYQGDGLPAMAGISHAHAERTQLRYYRETQLEGIYADLFSGIRKSAVICQSRDQVCDLGVGLPGMETRHRVFYHLRLRVY